MKNQPSRIPVIDTICVNYDAFCTGIEMARSELFPCDYWQGSCRIRETRHCYYLLVPTTQTVSGARRLAHKVYTVPREALGLIKLDKFVRKLWRWEERFDTRSVVNTRGEEHEEWFVSELIPEQPRPDFYYF